MKKIILSALLMSAFSIGLFAKGNVKMPIIEKGTFEVSTAIKVEQGFKQKVSKPLVNVCTSTWLPICAGGRTVGYMSAYVCAADHTALYNLLSSFQCSGGSSGNLE
jgi:hypothetical protein